jgi:N-acetyl-alpha-D-muramate 1-phosphate uridylyltransferase
MMSVLRNDGRWEASNAVYADGRVLAYDKRTPRADMHWIDYGLGGLEQAALDLVPANTRDLCELYRALASKRLLCGFPASKRFYEIGTPATLAETDAFLRSRQGNPRSHGGSRDIASRQLRQPPAISCAGRVRRSARRSFGA